VNRGSLRIYLGYAPGAGVTCALLSEGHRRAEHGTDVVVAVAETHGRPYIEALLAGLEIISPATVPYRGTRFEEMDLCAVLVRRPAVALVDDLAHHNVPGAGHARRWQDAEELLAAGIDVISTVTIGQLESLSDVAEKITGVPRRETVPDPVVRAAGEVELVDVAPQALQERLAHGLIYPAERAGAAPGSWFQTPNLSALRELALLWLVGKLASDRQRSRPGGQVRGDGHARERVVVALSGGPEDETLIRRAARIAARSAGDLLAVHAARPAGPAAAGRAALAAQRQLTVSLGGTYHQLADPDIPAALLAFAQGQNATQLVLGTTRRTRLAALLPTTTIRSQLIRRGGGIGVHIVPCPSTVSGVPPHSPRPSQRQGPEPRRRPRARGDHRRGGPAPTAAAGTAERRPGLRLTALLVAVIVLSARLAAPATTLDTRSSGFDRAAALQQPIRPTIQAWTPPTQLRTTSLGGLGLRRSVTSMAPPAAGCCVL
jgi:two-component system sensor histidine kinase KdpD